MDTVLIEGLIITPLIRIAQPKGDILHAMKCTSMGYMGFGEAYFSIVNQGNIKGWKRHRRVTLNLVVPVGTIRFIIRDDRHGSLTNGRIADLTLGGENYVRLTIPPGLWVAFEGRSEGLNLLLNIANEEHNPSEADNLELQAFPFSQKILNEPDSAV